MRLLTAFQRQPREWIFAEASVCVFLIGVWDYRTGYEVSLSLLYCAPIFVVAWCGDKKLGLLLALLAGLVWWWADVLAGHPYVRSWHEAWETFVRISFFIITAIGTSAVKLQRDSSEARIKLLEYSHRLEREIIGISEQEQRRIGQDLHDGICQCLAAISCSAAALKTDLARKGLPSEARVADQLAALLRDAIAQTRDLARGLVPVQMDQAGLASALEELAASASRLLGIDLTYRAIGLPLVEDSAAAMHLYRIAQEAINNATRHGKAKAVDIILIEHPGKITLRITDDGEGISKTTPNGGGIGLGLMHYRARLAGGELRIEEPNSGGTVVSCQISAEEVERQHAA